jgi:hypothetical protein
MWRKQFYRLSESSIVSSRELTHKKDRFTLFGRNHSGRLIATIWFQWNVMKWNKMIENLRICNADDHVLWWKCFDKMLISRNINSLLCPVNPVFLNTRTDFDHLNNRCKSGERMGISYRRCARRFQYCFRPISHTAILGNRSMRHGERNPNFHVRPGISYSQE